MQIAHNFYAEVAYTTAKQHGFHSGAFNDKVFVALIISEVYEALDAHRKGRLYAKEITSAEMDAEDEVYKQWYESNVSGTFEDELADVVIRLYDYSQCLGLSLERFMDPFENYFFKLVDKKERWFPEFAYDLTHRIITLFSDYSDWAVPITINTLYVYAQSCQIDLCRHVVSKMRYNRLRPYRHNAKY
jgi:NTP pyrophosphatase (non-canonical NTP hydrolase)